MENIEHLVERDAEIPTWFRIGGRADALARPGSVDELRALLAAFEGQPVRILGDGANLLVDDDGVDGLVLDLKRMAGVEFVEDDSGPVASPTLIRCQAGASLPKLITECVRRGLAGIETLAGIPASLGGAVVMNAGGAFGQIADVVQTVHGLTRQGEPVSLPRDQINFAYRHSGLNHLIVTGIDLLLRRLATEEQAGLRERLKEVMAYKKQSQPMAENSAGCYWKNPPDPADPSERISAGKLIDQCGLKGLTRRGAVVSDIHANFVVTKPGCRARDIIELMAEVRELIRAKTGIELTPEVVTWRRGDDP